MPARPSILILSFSPIFSDARVLKQVRLAAELGDVTTCGYGPAPEGVATHHQIPDHASIYPLNPKLLVARLGRVALRIAPAVQAARRLLVGASFDAVIANDIESLPLALSLRSRGGVLADLHEFSPGQHSNNPGWMRFVHPLLLSIARRELRRASVATTVAPAIAAEYARISHRHVDVVMNATPATDIYPSAVSTPLRLVHSGVALRNRTLELTIDAVVSSTNALELDLYLMPNDPAYLGELSERAARTTNVRVLPPVPYGDLVSTLNRYDVGVFVLPPLTRNYEWALPNKFFDYVQARLAVIIGPSSQMLPYVHRHQIGAVTDDFTASALTTVLDALTPSGVAQWKQNAHASAPALSMEEAVAPWQEGLNRMLATAATR